MGIKERAQGGFVVNSKETAEKALALSIELKDEIAPIEQEISELKEGVARWMKENDQKQIVLPEVSKHGTLVQRFNPNKWDGKLLLKLVKAANPKRADWQHVWQALTVRVPDPDKIQQAIRNDLVTEDEISEAYIQGTPQKPFVQVFSDD